MANKFTGFMNKCKSGAGRAAKGFFPFMKRHNRGLLIIMLALILVSLLMVTNLESTLESSHSMSVGHDYLLNCPSYGYFLSQNESGHRVYTVDPSHGDPQIFVPINTEMVNSITVRFSEPVTAYNLFQLYYSGVDTPLSEANSRFAVLSADKMSAVVSFPETQLTLLRLDIDATFSIDYIEISKVLASAPVRTYSTTAVVFASVFTVLLALMLVFEKQFGMRELIKSFFLSKFDKFKALIKEKKFVRFAVHILLYLAFAAFFVMLFTLILTSKYSIGYAVVFFFIGAGTVLIYLVDSFLSGNKNAAVMFLVITVTIGLAVTYFKAPSISGGWDEAIHYTNAVNLRVALFGGEWSLTDSDLAKNIYYYNLYNSAADSYFPNMLAGSHLPGEAQKSGSSLITSVAYLPSALIMAVTLLLGGDVIKMIFLAKAANVLVYAFVLYLGMRRLKSGVLMFASIAMVPTALFISTTINYDAWVLAFIGFSFMYYVSCMQDKENKIRTRDWAVILSTFFVGALAKAVYFFLSFPYFFTPKSKFKSDKHSLWCKLAAVGTLLLIALLMLVPFLMNTDSLTDDRGGSDVSAGGQLEYIFTNIPTYAKTLVTFLLDYVALDNALEFLPAMHPYSYTYTAAPFFASLTILMLVITSIIDRGECDDFVGYKRLKASSLVSFAGTLALVATALYISFTPVGAATINGCQYRYILPTLFALCYASGSRKIKCTINRVNLNHAVFAVLSVAAIGAFYGVFVENWINWVIKEGGQLIF